MVAVENFWLEHKCVIVKKLLHYFNNNEHLRINARIKIGFISFAARSDLLSAFMWISKNRERFAMHFALLFSLIQGFF